MKSTFSKFTDGIDIIKMHKANQVACLIILNDQSVVLWSGTNLIIKFRWNMVLLINWDGRALTSLWQ